MEFVIFGDGSTPGAGEGGAVPGVQGYGRPEAYPDRISEFRHNHGSLACDKEEEKRPTVGRG